jgi:XTP/dITP diphosphohydrolase
MKKISKLLIGTNNKGKYKEIKDLLPKYIKTHSTSEFKLKSPKEDGLTFRENSIIKAKHFSKRTKLICLADDSGLEIDMLDKSPGIYSARWGGKKVDFKRAINRVYIELSKKDKNWKYKKVKARFICALSICYLDKKIASVSGKVEGFISTEPKGNNGFGYDPIFIPKNKKKTFSEMSSSQKYKIDHRFVAFQKIKRFL